MKKILLIVVLGFALSGCSHVAGQNGSGSGQQAQTQRGGSEPAATIEGRFVKGKAAPKVMAQAFSGEEIDVSAHYGKRAVVLDFWAGWCPFCVAEMPELQKAQDRFGDDLVMIGVHRTDTESVAVGQRFADERGVSYILIKDSDGSLYRASGGIGMPTAVFIDKSGIVTEIKSGPKTAEEITEKVRALL